MIGTILGGVWDVLRWTWHDPDGYNFISGPLADVTLLGGAYAILRHHNCHAKGCWRLGRHPVSGTTYIVCRKHHPHDDPSAEQILAEHLASDSDPLHHPGQGPTPGASGPSRQTT